jgi:uncharacterized protein (DUF433 family)
MKNSPIVIDPNISFGRPTIAGTGVPTKEIASLYFAGDSIEFIAKDFALSIKQVKEAIKFELEKI